MAVAERRDLDAIDVPPREAEPGRKVITTGAEGCRRGRPQPGVIGMQMDGDAVATRERGCGPEVVEVPVGQQDGDRAQPETVELGRDGLLGPLARVDDDGLFEGQVPEDRAVRRPRTERCGEECWTQGRGRRDGHGGPCQQVGWDPRGYSSGSCGSLWSRCRTEPEVERGTTR